MNYTVKRYFFEQSAVREFYSGAYYDLFLVMRGSGVFRCSEVVLPAQQQNLITIHQALAKVPEVKDVNVNLVWYPAWDTSKMSRYARIALGIR